MRYRGGQGRARLREGLSKVAHITNWNALSVKTPKTKCCAIQ